MSRQDSFASLGPLLLARKGTAKPAMTPGASALDEIAGHQDAAICADDDIVVPLRRKDGADAAGTQATATANEASGDETRKRVAFTLRLDAQRHFRLRLASTIGGTSAQAIVTEALDAYFADNPELEALVARIEQGGPAPGRDH